MLSPFPQPIQSTRNSHSPYFGIHGACHVCLLPSMATVSVASLWWDPARVSYAAINLRSDHLDSAVCPASREVLTALQVPHLFHTPIPPIGVLFIPLPTPPCSCAYSELCLRSCCRIVVIWSPSRCVILHKVLRISIVKFSALPLMTMWILSSLKLLQRSFL